MLRYAHPLFLFISILCLIAPANAQLTISTQSEGAFKVSSRDGRRFKTIDTVTLNGMEKKALPAAEMDWILTISNKNDSYAKFKDRFDFVREGTQQTITLDFPLSRSKVLGSPINDSIAMYNQMIAPLQERRDQAALMQVEAFSKGNMEGYRRFSDSIVQLENAIGMLAVSQIIQHPNSMVSQFAFGLYCDYMPEEYFFSCYQQLSLAENLSLLPTRQLEFFEQKLANRVGMPLPNGTLTTIDGQSINPGISNGKVRVLYFTSSTCGPCKLLKPKLEEISDTVLARDIEWITISIEVDEEGMALALADAKRTKAAWQQVVLNFKDEPLNKYLVGGYPSLIIADKQAVIQKRILGYTATTLPTLLEAMDRFTK